ncbi:hypothetical protein LBMAG56_25240 [Verrucomicrobiota bacterium]|nr:hypothetical protein LBMAG56_25240 [Verrucomicrobiota bacterium]
MSRGPGGSGNTLRPDPPGCFLERNRERRGGGWGAARAILNAEMEPPLDTEERSPAEVRATREFFGVR